MGADNNWLGLRTFGPNAFEAQMGTRLVDCLGPRQMQHHSRRPGALLPELARDQITSTALARKWQLFSTRVDNKVHVGSSASKVGPFQYKCALRSTLWQLRLELCKVHLCSSGLAPKSQLFSTSVVYKAHRSGLVPKSHLFSTNSAYKVHFGRPRKSQLFRTHVVHLAAPGQLAGFGMTALGHNLGLMCLHGVYEYQFSSDIGLQCSCKESLRTGR